MKKKTDLRVVAMADLHGALPAVPPCDVLILSGDIAPDLHSNPAHPSNMHRQIGWFNGEFRDWLHSVQAEAVVATAGNHDFALARMRNLLKDDLPWHLLIDQPVELFGWKFYGSPWVGNLPGWAFNLQEDQLKIRWSRIPDDTEILVLHGPPYQFGDGAIDNNYVVELTGSPSLRTRLLQLPDLLLATYGHIHEGRGVYQLANITLVNAARRDRHYNLIGGPPWSTRLDQLCPLAIV